jgi:hypothetical protein
MKFLIRFTVGEAAVGPVLAALNSHPGVVFDHLAIEPLELKKTPEAPDTAPAKVTGKAAPAKKPHKRAEPTALTAQAHVLRILSDGNPRRFTDIETVMKSLGFKSCGSTMRNLLDKGLAGKTPDGLWQTTNQRQIPAPTLVKEA